MRIYVLHFRSAAAFTRAFDSVMDARDVASCLVEPEHSDASASWRRARPPMRSSSTSTAMAVSSGAASTT